MYDLGASIGFALLGVVIVFVFVELSLISVRGYRAVQEGKRARPAEKVQSNPRAKVLIVGDSTAYGTGATTPAFSLAGRLIAAHPEFTVINAAQNAMGLKELITKLDEMADESFDLVIVQIGGIDTLKLTRCQTIAARLEQILRRIAQKFNTPVTVLVSVNNVGAAQFFRLPVRYLYSWHSRKVSRACGAVCAATGVVHVPLFHERSSDPLRQGGVHFAPDGIHPNDRGYEIWYAEVRQQIAPYVQALYS